jgi:hypothetical protein
LPRSPNAFDDGALAIPPASQIVSNPYPAYDAEGSFDYSITSSAMLSSVVLSQAVCGDSGMRECKIAHFLLCTRSNWANERCANPGKEFSPHHLFTPLGAGRVQFDHSKHIWARDGMSVVGHTLPT